MHSICKKCDNLGTVMLRRKDLYCRDCFLTNINHKFRACIGKNKILSANDKVLICLSGGPGSTALLDLIHYGLSLDSHKKLRIWPVFLHIMGVKNGVDDTLIAKAITEQCTLKNFNIHIVHISEYVNNVETNSLQVGSNSKEQFDKLLESMPISSKKDFTLKVIRDLFIRYGKMLQCKYIFTAETSETLAINLLSNLSNGRGAQIQHDIGFCDSRDEVKILRPMRDISKEELQHYIQIKQLIPQDTHNTENHNSIQGVIKNFVTDLQENFQSTISTVCKTADKIGIYDGIKDKKICELCKSNIGNQIQTISALEATNYSGIVSQGQLQDTNTDSNYVEANLSLFPQVNKSLCYTCSRHFSVMDKSQLPVHIKEILCK